MHRVFVTTVLALCAGCTSLDDSSSLDRYFPAGDDAWLDQEADDPRRGPPSYELELGVDAAVPGQDLTLLVKGADPFTTVRIVRGQPGSHCPAALPGLCLDVQSPKTLLLASTGADGRVEASIALPASVPDGKSMTVQAFSEDEPFKVSPPITRETGQISAEGPERLVFITSIVYTGIFGGERFGDAECQLRAEAGGHPGLFKAWLSTDDDPPGDRFTDPAEPYVLFDGTVIGTGYDDLIDGELDAELSLNEFGGDPGVSQWPDRPERDDLVWTGTQHTGEPQVSNTCGDWTDPLEGSQWGTWDVSEHFAGETGWTQYITGGECSDEHLAALYCFEQ